MLKYFITGLLLFSSIPLALACVILYGLKGLESFKDEFTDLLHDLNG